MDGKIFFLAMVLGILVLAWLGAGVLWRAAELSEIVAPIDQQAFEELNVITVGTGNEYENPERHGPSTAIGLGHTIVLVDAGRGVAEGLRSARIPLDQPKLILLTNLLPLNTMGLDDLLFTGWLTPRTERLRVVGPRGTRALVEGHISCGDRFPGFAVVAVWFRASQAQCTASAHRDLVGGS